MNGDFSDTLLERHVLFPTLRTCVRLREQTASVKVPNASVEILAVPILIFNGAIAIASSICHVCFKKIAKIILRDT